MRLFVAVDLSDDARGAIAVEQARIAEALGPKASMKWVTPGAAHLTLVFLGNVEAGRAASVVETVGASLNLPAFDLILEGAGVFPPRGAPRVLWIGTTAGAAALIALQREMASRVAGLGIAVDARPFHPHLTIGRWRESRPSDGRRALAAAPAGAIARVRVDHATLYESRLSPSGPDYTALTRATLTQRL